MWWHELSWPEVAALDKETPVVIPLGSCEQHGHHLPLFVDTMQVQAIAERAEAALGERAVVLPTLWLGSSHHHRDFAGTVSVKPSLYAQVVRSVAESVLDAGFRRLFFLNGHGGNIVPGTQALTELVAEDDRADGAYLVFGSWWQVGSRSLADPAVGMQTPNVTHACEYETSLMLAVRPDLVHMDRLEESGPAMSSKWFGFEQPGNRVSVVCRWRRMSSTGTLRSPSLATKAKGQAMLEAVTRDVVAFVDELAGWAALPVIGPK